MARTLQRQNAVVETSEAQIAVHWWEEEYFYPSAKFIGQANLTDPSLVSSVVCQYWFQLNRYWPTKD